MAVGSTATATAIKEEVKEIKLAFEATQKAELAHSKFTNINNDYSYNEYRSLIVEYGKNSKFPEIK